MASPESTSTGSTINVQFISRIGPTEWLADDVHPWPKLAGSAKKIFNLGRQ